MFSAFFFGALFIAGIIMVPALILMLLWNALMIPIFHITGITLLQALGIFILARLLFGGRRGGHGHRKFSHRKHHFHHKRMHRCDESYDRRYC